MGYYEPPFTSTESMFDLIFDISSRLTEIKLIGHGVLTPKLRKTNQVKSIQSSLAIEQNTLSLEQVTAIIEGKRILGNPREIREVKNAFEVYHHSLEFNPMSIKDLLKAHRMMMEDLITENGRFRSGDVGVFAGAAVVHIAPPARLVPGEIQDLFEWYQASKLHPLIKSCIFHHEFEFIHPFADGNGRMGRLWHSLLLGSWNEIFYWLPIEDLIRERQQEYYNAIEKSNKVADSQYFVEFMLQIILDSLEDLESVGTFDESVFEDLPDNYIELIKLLGSDELSLAEIMVLMDFKHKPSFRKKYIIPALQDGVLEMTNPNQPNNPNQKYRLTNKYRKRLK